MIISDKIRHPRKTGKGFRANLEKKLKIHYFEALEKAAK
jgi:hypothetical protein